MVVETGVRKEFQLYENKEIFIEFVLRVGKIPAARKNRYMPHRQDTKS